MIPLLRITAELIASDKSTSVTTNISQRSAISHTHETGILLRLESFLKHLKETLMFYSRHNLKRDWKPAYISRSQHSTSFRSLNPRTESRGLINGKCIW